MQHLRTTANRNRLTSTPLPGRLGGVVGANAMKPKFPRKYVEVDQEGNEWNVEDTGIDVHKFRITGQGEDYQGSANEIDPMDNKSLREILASARSEMSAASSHDGDFNATGALFYIGSALDALDRGNTEHAAKSAFIAGRFYEHVRLRRQLEPLVWRERNRKEGAKKAAENADPGWSAVRQALKKNPNLTPKEAGAIYDAKCPKRATHWLDTFKDYRRQARKLVGGG
jgi:hypothetical protein